MKKNDNGAVQTFANNSEKNIFIIILLYKFEYWKKKPTHLSRLIFKFHSFGLIYLEFEEELLYLIGPRLIHQSLFLKIDSFHDKTSRRKIIKLDYKLCLPFISTNIHPPGTIDNREIKINSNKSIYSACIYSNDHDARSFDN